MISGRIVRRQALHLTHGIPQTRAPRRSTLTLVRASMAPFPPSAPSGLEQVGSNKHFGGYNLRYKHDSGVLKCKMAFTVYLPPQAASGPVPVLFWLSGLTCTDENFIQKSGEAGQASPEQKRH